MAALFGVKSMYPIRSMFAICSFENLGIGLFPATASVGGLFHFGWSIIIREWKHQSCCTAARCQPHQSVSATTCS